MENEEESSQGARASVREYRVHPYRTPIRARTLSHQGMIVVGNEILCNLKLLDVSCVIIFSFVWVLFVVFNHFKFSLIVRGQWVWVQEILAMPTHPRQRLTG